MAKITGRNTGDKDVIHVQDDPVKTQYKLHAEKGAGGDYLMEDAMAGSPKGAGAQKE